MRQVPVILFFPVACILGSCSSGGEASPNAFRVAVATFSHETCTFCPGGDVTVEDWERVSPPLGGEALLREGGYIGGFVSMAEDYGDMELIGLSSPLGVFGGSSRSWNTEEAFNHFLDLMIRDLEASLPVDGVYLALHGAMAVRNVPRPEAEIARRFREVVGPDVPIAASFDLHGNEDAEFLEWADFAFTTKRYPHYDAALQGSRAARALHMTLKGMYSPTTATRTAGNHHGYGPPMDRSLTFHGYHGAGQAVGSPGGECLCQRVLWLSMVRCAGCRGYDPCHDE